MKSCFLTGDVVSLYHHRSRGDLFVLFSAWMDLSVMHVRLLFRCRIFFGWAIGFDFRDHIFFFGVGLSVLGSASHLMLVFDSGISGLFRIHFDFLISCLVNWRSGQNFNIFDGFFCWKDPK